MNLRERCGGHGRFRERGKPNRATDGNEQGRTATDRQPSLRTSVLDSSRTYRCSNGPISFSTNERIWQKDNGFACVITDPESMNPSFGSPRTSDTATSGDHPHPTQAGAAPSLLHQPATCHNSAYSVLQHRQPLGVLGGHCVIHGRQPLPQFDVDTAVALAERYQLIRRPDVYLPCASLRVSMPLVPSPDQLGSPPPNRPTDTTPTGRGRARVLSAGERRIRASQVPAFSTQTGSRQSLPLPACMFRRTSGGPNRTHTHAWVHVRRPHSSTRQRLWRTVIPVRSMRTPLSSSERNTYAPVATPPSTRATVFQLTDSNPTTRHFCGPRCT